MKSKDYERAWHELKDKLLSEYPAVAHLAYVSNGDSERGEMSKHVDVLEYMDQLDGTQDFSNLLNDMGDE